METSNNNEELLRSEDAKKIIENLLFITDRPLTPKRISEVVDGVTSAAAVEIITELQKEFSATGRAVQVIEIGGGFQMSTKPEYGRWVRKLYNEKMTARLSPAALETLAIIAYKQPVTRAEVEAIRGVDIGAPLEKLLERSLVRILGKRDTIGRPMVYGTTDEFLRLFGLNKVSELPDIDIFAAKTAPKDEQGNLPFEDTSGAAIIPLSEEEAEEFNVAPPAEESVEEQEPVAVAVVPSEAEPVIEAAPERAEPAQSVAKDEEPPAAKKEETV